MSTVTESISAEAPAGPPEEAAEAPASQPAAEAPLTVIERKTGWKALDLRDLWRHRELLYFFTWRDIKVRYKQTAFGALWAILQPVATMVVFSIFFGRFVGLDQRTGGIAYPVFVFAGLLPWNLFARSMGSSGNSVVAASNIITKIYFPRLIIPIATIGVGLVDFAISFGVLLILMVAYGIAPGPAVLLLPVLLLLIVMAALSVGIWLSAMTVSYRDFVYVVPFLTQMWMYLSPVIYPVNIVPEQYRWLLAFNPMTGLVDGFRWCLLGQEMDWHNLAVGSTIIVVAFFASLIYFRRAESTFADIV